MFSAKSVTAADAILAFIAGCLLTGAASRLAASASAQSSRADGIHVCVAADRVLRLAPSWQCPEGEQSLYFKKPEVNLDVAKPDHAQVPDGNASIDKRRLAELERRLEVLEKSVIRGVIGSRAVAPFEVFDRTGRRVFDVDADDHGTRARLFNSGGKAVAHMWALPNGGQFTATAAASDLSAYVGIFRNGANAGLQVLDGGTARIDVGKDEQTKGYRLKILGSGGKTVAGIGQNHLGTGTAQVGDEAGNVKAILSVGEQSKGIVNIFNANGTAVIAVTEGAAAGGLLQIMNAGGQPMVEAGVSKEGFGVVRAGPEGFKPGLGLFGLPGSYIAGKPQ